MCEEDGNIEVLSVEGIVQVLVRMPSICEALSLISSSTWIYHPHYCQVITLVAPRICGCDL